MCGVNLDRHAESLHLARWLILADKDNQRPEEILQLLDRSAVTFQAVLTKADKVGPRDRARTLDQVRGALRAHPAAYPEIVVTSSETGEGIPTLRAIIAALDA